MNLKTFLEEFQDSFKITRNDKTKIIEIFVNPTPKEMEEASDTIRGLKCVRFMAIGSQKKVYVFSPTIIHFTVERNLKLNGDVVDPRKKTNLHGVAVKNKTGKWEFHSSDMTPIAINYNKAKKDFLWLNKYINVDEYFKTTTHDMSKNMLVMPDGF